MFNVGDRVRYKEQHEVGMNGSYNGFKAGLIGTVINLKSEVYGMFATVEFDKEQPNHVGRHTSLYGQRNGCYCANLDYISYKYDPTQAGDTDEDI